MMMLLMIIMLIPRRLHLDRVIHVGVAPPAPSYTFSANLDNVDVEQTPLRAAAHCRHGDVAHFLTSVHGADRFVHRLVQADTARVWRRALHRRRRRLHCRATRSTARSHFWPLRTGRGAAYLAYLSAAAGTRSPRIRRSFELVRSVGWRGFAMTLRAALLRVTTPFVYGHVSRFEHFARRPHAPHSPPPGARGRHPRSLRRHSRSEQLWPRATSCAPPRPSSSSPSPTATTASRSCSSSAGRRTRTLRAPTPICASFLTTPAFTASGRGHFIEETFGQLMVKQIRAAPIPHAFHDQFGTYLLYFSDRLADRWRAAANRPHQRPQLQWRCARASTTPSLTLQAAFASHRTARQLVRREILRSSARSPRTRWRASSATIASVLRKVKLMMRTMTMVRQVQPILNQIDSWDFELRPSRCNSPTTANCDRFANRLASIRSYCIISNFHFYLWHNLYKFRLKVR
jgi:hypothetical protein